MRDESGKPKHQYHQSSADLPIIYSSQVRSSEFNPSAAHPAALTHFAAGSKRSELVGAEQRPVGPARHCIAKEIEAPPGPAKRRGLDGQRYAGDLW